MTSCTLQSTSLLRGKTRRPRWCQFQGCFNPLPSCEGRRAELAGQMLVFLLQSTSLLRGKTKMRKRIRLHESGFNPLPSCEGRRLDENGLSTNSALQSTSLLRGKTRLRRIFLIQLYASIHFPLAREDRLPVILDSAVNASIHFPLAREDLIRR